MSKSNTSISTETFAKALKSTFASVKTMRGKVQSLLVFAVRHYVSSGNTIYLSMIQHETDTVHGLPSKGMQAYIQAAANVEFVRNKDGERVYRKVSLADNEVNMPNPATCDEAVLAKAWYDWLAENKIGRSQPDWKLEKYVLTVLATLRKHEVTADTFSKALKSKAAA